MSDCGQLWEEFVKLANEIEKTRVKLLNSCSSEVSNFMQSAFQDPAKCGAAFELIHWLPPNMREQFLAQLVESASFGNKYSTEARNIILELPRGWTINNIQSIYDRILRRESADVEEFGLMLSLAKELDKDLAQDIAVRATKHRNPTVQEIGTEYLEGHDSITE